MDRFPDGMHVWLRSTLRAAYLFADDDGSGVSLSTCRAMMNAAWQVQRVVLRDGTPCFFLQNAAYGRYLALSPYLAPHGHRGRRAILRDFREPQQRNIRWRAIAAGDVTDDVLLCTLEDQERYLRAHGRWRTCSCITVDDRRSTMTHWTVVQIHPRPAPPALPTPSTVSSLPLLLPLLTFVDLHGTRFLEVGTCRFHGRVTRSNNPEFLTTSFCFVFSVNSMYKTC
jgi:hypothetical protein